MTRRRVLHVIHDFLPRHQAGSEIYACDLAREQAQRHEVFVCAAEYDPATPHGTIRWRVHDGLPVIEIVNNWEFARFEDSYSSPRINRQFGHVLDATRPDVVHVHNLLNLSFDLPRLARERGIAVVATLHDYTLVCASGGQRVHVAESHVCHEIDPDRCARCFAGSPWQAQMAVGRITSGSAGRAAGRIAASLRKRLPRLATKVADRVPAPRVSAGDIRRRIAYARHVFEQVDLFVAPSRAIADAFRDAGVDPSQIEISDYGFPVRSRKPRVTRHDAVTFGFVGTLVWHKGVHVLLDAASGLRGRYRIEIHGNPDVFPDYAARLRGMSASLPVEFAGPFAREAVADVFARLDVLVVPSLWPENSPLVIHEAMLHGVPVIGARTGGIPDLIGQAGFLYDPFSPEALRACMQRFVDEPTLAGQLAAHAAPVKTIADDAAEWDARYERLTAPAADLVATPV